MLASASASHVIPNLQSVAACVELLHLGFPALPSPDVARLRPKLTLRCSKAERLHPIPLVPCALLASACASEVRTCIMEQHLGWGQLGRTVLQADTWARDTLIPDSPDQHLTVWRLPAEGTRALGSP